LLDEHRPNGSLPPIASRGKVLGQAHLLPTPR
jgi:hypothetical protein